MKSQLANQVNFSRLFKFGFVGIVCAGCQFALLHLLVNSLNWEGNKVAENVANVFAFFSSAQLNFILSYHITWNDRKSGSSIQRILRQALSFNGMAFGSWLINQTVFALADSVTNYRSAFLVSIASVAIVSYTISHKFVFPKIRTAERESVQKTFPG